LYHFLKKFSPKTPARCYSDGEEITRNFRFASPISTPHIDQPASLGKVLAQFGLSLRAGS
jgi:hypothetical protein